MATLELPDNLQANQLVERKGSRWHINTQMFINLYNTSARSIIAKVTIVTIAALFRLVRLKCPIVQIPQISELISFQVMWHHLKIRPDSGNQTLDLRRIRAAHLNTRRTNIQATHRQPCRSTLTHVC